MWGKTSHFMRLFQDALHLHDSIRPIAVQFGYRDADPYTEGMRHQIVS